MLFTWFNETGWDKEGTKENIHHLEEIEKVR